MPLTRNQQQDGINDPGRISKVTLEYLNQLLLRYPEESRQIASDIVGGFQEAIDDIEDINMDDMDEAYNMLYQNLMTMPTFQGIQSRLAAITLAKFFLEKFQYLPTPSIPLIQTSESHSSPSPAAISRSPSIDSADVPRGRAASSAASASAAQLQARQSPAHVNQIESARLSHHASPVGNEVRTDSARNMASNSLASTAMHNHASANSSLNHSVPTNLSEAEFLYRQRVNAVPHMAVAYSGASPAVQFSANNSSLQLPPGVVLSRVQAMPQQLTLYGPNGQPGIQANLPPVMSTSAGVAHVPTTYRQILPRAPTSTPTAQSNSARHNLPPQVHPNRQLYR